MFRLIIQCILICSACPFRSKDESSLSSLHTELNQQLNYFNYNVMRNRKQRRLEEKNGKIIGTSNLTIYNRSVLENILQDGCKNIGGEGLGTNKSMEEKKNEKSLKFAVVYSGQVCHGRGSDSLWDPIQMGILWNNKNIYLHEPLTEWGEVDLFGLFEEMAVGSPAIGHDHHKAEGCNDFVKFVNWTKYEFMPSEAHIKKGMAEKRSVTHGEERRSEALYRFIGDVNWEGYDMIFQFRPDVMFRKKVLDWGINLNKINAAHFESNGPKECDPLKLMSVPQPAGLPAIGDPFIIYPKRWTPIFFFFGSSVMGRGALSIFKNKCRCCNITLARDVHVLDTQACHNTRSCLYHPIYYLFGERLCGEQVRPGESNNEFCLSGKADDSQGQNNCVMATNKQLRGMSKEQVAEVSRWNARHYRVYEGQMELAPCMVNSTTGWVCVK